MSLSWGDAYFHSILPPDLLNRMQEIMIDPLFDRDSYDGESFYYNGKTVEPIFNIPTRHPPRVSRQKMRAWLKEGVDIKYGKALKSIRLDEPGQDYGKVTAAFEDGSSYDGSLIVGTDGAHSRVRKLLFASSSSEGKLTETSISMLNFSTTYPVEVAQSIYQSSPLGNICHHPDLEMYYLIAPVNVIQGSSSSSISDSSQFQNLMVFKNSRFPPDEVLKNAKSRVEFVKRCGAQFVDPWQSAALHIREDIDIPLDSGRQWVPVPWDDCSGRITLAGDAAHPMFPSRAQNLSMGLQDVASIVNAVVEIEKAPHQAIADNRAATNVTSRDAPPKLPAQAKHIGRYQDEMIK
jgi:2-polyprenyl-6-methoxyphenol hydroxylase-like FAD-dependent oxidoreductase